MKKVDLLKEQIAEMPPKKAYEFAKEKSMNKKGERDLHLFGELCYANVERALQKQRLRQMRLPYKD